MKEFAGKVKFIDTAKINKKYDDAEDLGEVYVYNTNKTRTKLYVTKVTLKKVIHSTNYEEYVGFIGYDHPERKKGLIKPKFNNLSGIEGKYSPRSSALWFRERRDKEAKELLINESKRFVEELTQRLEASKRCLETIKTSNIEEREYIKYEPYKDAINKYIKEKGIE